MHELGDRFNCSALKTHAWQFIMQTKPEYAVSPAETLLRSGRRAAGPNNNNNNHHQSSSPPPPLPPGPNRGGNNDDAFGFMGPPPAAGSGMPPPLAGGKATTASGGHLPGQQKPRPPKAADVVGEWKKRLQGSWAQCQPSPAGQPPQQRPMQQPPPQQRPARSAVQQTPTMPL